MIEGIVSCFSSSSSNSLLGVLSTTLFSLSFSSAFSLLQPTITSNRAISKMDSFTKTCLPIICHLPILVFFYRHKLFAKLFWRYTFLFFKHPTEIGQLRKTTMDRYFFNTPVF